MSDTDDERRTTNGSDDDADARSRRELGSSAEFLLTIVRANDTLPDLSDVSRLRERGRKRPQAEQPPLELGVPNVKWLRKKGGWALRMNFKDEKGEWKTRTVTPQVMQDRVCVCDGDDDDVSDDGVNAWRRRCQ